MTTFLTYGKAYTDRIIPFPIAKEFLELKKQGYFDIKPGENKITCKDTRINNFRDPEYYLPNNGFEVTGFKIFLKIDTCIYLIIKQWKIVKTYLKIFYLIIQQIHYVFQEQKILEIFLILIILNIYARINFFKWLSYKVNGIDTEEKLYPIMGKVIKLWKKLDSSNDQLIDNENITKKVIETKRSYYQKLT